MSFDFDSVTERRGTMSLKYDSAPRRGKPAGILPLWVADMDFSTADCIKAALAQVSRFGVLGYSEPDEAFHAVLRAWFARRYGYSLQAEWLVQTPGVVSALYTAVRALTEAGDAVLIQSPVYYPFAAAVRDTGRRLVTNELVLSDGRYHIDFDDLSAKIQREKVKLLILCSPHNPVGRVWRRDELEGIAEICLRHGVVVVADEIHQDFIFPGCAHTVFAALGAETQNITITCTSPSKSFNLAGLQLSNIIIANKALRRAFRAEIGRGGYSQPSLMGLVACRAAYSAEGAAWLEALLAYLGGNMALVRAWAAEWPEIRFIEPEGTYLAWIDCRGLGLSPDALAETIEQKAGLWLDDGRIFGPGGEGFQRLNTACPRSVLAGALERWRGAF
ncbi:MAG: pyridoxal phosphate-dependent aminotransferase [Gracilibacteraceae bacterium]|nr:pyridoxal phosphate-dependent aminotransferase [Gracilibacteraceae bacterium]